VLIVVYRSLDTLMVHGLRRVLFVWIGLLFSWKKFLEEWMTKDVPMWKGLCVSMVTHKRARENTLTIVKALRKKIDAISGLITPTIVTKKWLYDLKEAGADKIGVAVDAATPELSIN